MVQSSDFVVVSFPWALKIVNDIIVMAPSLEIIFMRIRMVLLKCRELNMTISRRKFRVGEEVKFAGYMIGTSGVKPNPEKVECLASFPRPTDLTSLRSFLGLANQLGSFIPDLTHVTSRLRQLLRKDVHFLWLAEHESDFVKAKEILTSQLLVKSFDSALPTEILSDASCLHGIGFMLMQRDAQERPRIVQCGSFSLNLAQRNYAVIELEMLGIVRAVQRCDYYVRGIPNFTVVTDHRPLVGIFNKPITEIQNTRLLRFREALSPYNFDIVWTAGKDHLIADALSRVPLFDGVDCPTEGGESQAALCYRVAEDPALQQLFDSLDSNYNRIIKALRQRKTSKSLPASHPGLAFKNIWDQLSLFDDEEETLLLCGDRIVVPESARKHILSLFHLPHQGVTKTRMTAQQLYYWPGMNNEIKLMTQACQACQIDRPSQQAEPQQPMKVTAPMTHMAVDLADFSGQDWMILADGYSGYILTARLSTTTTAKVTSVLEKWFRTFGYPEILRSDNGPQFRTEFGDWCRNKGIKHETSSPYFPSSNGLAESAVKSAKVLWKKCQTTKEDYEIALTEFRASCREDGYSPNQLFFGRNLRTALPRLPEKDEFCPRGREARNKIQQQKSAKVDTRAKALPALQPGSKVRIQNPLTKLWDSVGIIQKIEVYGRSYSVLLDNGKTIRRNRRFLRAVSPVDANVPESAHPQMNEDVNFPQFSAEAPRRSARLATKNSTV